MRLLVQVEERAADYWARAVDPWRCEAAQYAVVSGQDHCQIE